MRPNESGVELPLSRELIASGAQRLDAHLTSYGLELGIEVCQKEIEFLGLVLVKNQFLNLTAIRDFNKGIVLHLLDSLLTLKPLYRYCPFLEFENDEDQEGHISVLDMGCGGGFPSIPLLLADSSIHALLCDSVKKKITACQEFVLQMGLTDRVQTSSERLESLPSRDRQFPIIVSRALAPLPVLLEYAAPLLYDDGILIVAKGDPDQEEIKRGEKVARMVGMELIDREDYELPDSFGHRSFYVYGKSFESKVDLPRAVGMATSHPLA